jgi:hypothetical protein
MRGPISLPFVVLLYFYKNMDLINVSVSALLEPVYTRTIQIKLIIIYKHKYIQYISNTTPLLEDYTEKVEIR